MPCLHECNKRCEASVNLNELNETEIIYVARVPGRHVLSVDILLGTRFLAYCTAPGRAMLPSLPTIRISTSAMFPLPHRFSIIRVGPWPRSTSASPRPAGLRRGWSATWPPSS